MKILKRIILTVIVLALVAGTAAFVGMYYVGETVINTALDSLDKPAPPAANQPEGHGEVQSRDSSSSTEVKPDNTKEKTENQKTSTEKDSDKDLGKIYLTSEQVQAIKNKVTLNDKILASRIVLSKLSSDQLKYLTGLLSGGLTDKEFQEAKSFVLSNFSQSDISEIYGIYKKYTK